MPTSLCAGFISDDNNSKGRGILACASGDGVHWTNNTPTGQSSQTSPSLAFFNFEYWMAFIANDSSNQILMISSTDGAGGKWTPQNTPVHQFSGIPPALIVFNGGLWLVFVENSNMSNGMCKGADVDVCFSPDGIHWDNNTKVGQLSKTTPGLAVFNGKLWMSFVEAVNDNNISVCSSADGRTWSTNKRVISSAGQAQLSKTATSMAVFNNLLWLAFVANDNAGQVLLCYSADGINWSPNIQTGQTSKDAPSLFVVNNQLCLTFISSDSGNQIWLCTSGDGSHWSSNVQMGQGTQPQTSNYALSVITGVWHTGAMYPRYQVLTVIYAPPGTNGGKSQSSVDYGSGSSAGTTTSASSSFKAGVDVSVNAGVGIISTTTDFSFSGTTTNTSSVEIKKSQNLDLKVPGPGADGINHGEDQFVLWLNPMINVTTDAQGNVKWAPAVNGTMLIQYVLVAELTNPNSMRPGVKQALDAAGLTPQDYAQILNTNPFASKSAAIDPDRYLLCSQSFPYEAPHTATDPVDLTTFNQTNATTNTNTESTQVQYGVTVKVDEGIASFLKLAVTDTFQWTNTSSTTNTNTTTQSATLTMGGPAFGYTGPTNVLVYWDTVFSTFMFAFATEPPSATGTVMNGLGHAVVKQAVTLNVGAKTFSTFTAANGEYSFFGAPAGAGTVSVGANKFPVTVGPGTPKAALRLPLLVDSPAKVI